MRNRSMLLLAATLALSGSAFAQQSLTDLAHERAVELLEAHPEMPFDPFGLLVRFEPETSESERASLRSMVGAGLRRSYAQVPGLELIDVAIPLGTALELLRPHVLYAEPDRVVHSTQTPNDQFFSLQWGMNNTGQTINNDPGTAGADMNVAAAWDTITGDPGFVIAVIDSGTQWDHPDLANNIYSNPGEIDGNKVDDDGNGFVDDVRGWDFLRNDNKPDDKDGHGTHTAGTVGAEGNNGIGVAGVLWRCQIMPLKFIGPAGGFTSDAIAAIQYATQMGVKVSNNSWGGPGFSQSLYDAIDASKAVGHVFVAAAGNDGVDTDSSGHYPSSYDLDNIISVAANDNDDGLASFSNWGASTVDVGAPGVNIASTYKGSNYVWNSGTSMASPHVAGVAALVYSQNPGWTYTQVVDRILSTVRPVASLAGKSTTGGVVDAAACVAGGGGGPTLPGKAGGPSPANGASGVSTSATLAWTAGSGATTSDVYFGTAPNPGAGEFQGNQSATTFDPGPLAAGTTYYWRIDSVNSAGTTPGDVWSFTTATGGGGGISLAASGYKVKGVMHADLTWSGASTGTVEIYRDGGLIATTANDGAYTDDTGQKGSATFVYQVCETGGGACSNTATVVF